MNYSVDDNYTFVSTKGSRYFLARDVPGTTDLIVVTKYISGYSKYGDMLLVARQDVLDFEGDSQNINSQVCEYIVINRSTHELQEFSKLEEIQFVFEKNKVIDFFRLNKKMDQSCLNEMKNAYTEQIVLS